MKQTYSLASVFEICLSGVCPREKVLKGELFFNQFTRSRCIISINKGCYCSALYKKPLVYATHTRIINILRLDVLQMDCVGFKFLWHRSS